jgi:hypothetical protein
MCSKNYESKKPKHFIVWKIARKTAKVSLNVTNLSKKENCINARGWMGVWQKYVVMPSPDGTEIRALTEACVTWSCMGAPI